MRFYRKWAHTYKMNSYLASNSPYTIKLASKLKLRLSTFIGWGGLICRLIICFAYSSILKADFCPQTVLVACYYIINDAI